LLPSGKALDQCIQYASNMYRASFRLHQSRALAAHITWWLRHNYCLTRKQAHGIVERLLPPSKEEKEEQKRQEQDPIAQLEEGGKGGMSVKCNDSIDEQEEEKEEDKEELKKGEEKKDTRPPWSDETEEIWRNRMQRILIAQQMHTKGSADAVLLERIRLHYSILVDIEYANMTYINKQQGQEQITSTNSHNSPYVYTTCKQFSLCPQSAYTCRFVRFDKHILRDMGSHWSCAG